MTNSKKVIFLNHNPEATTGHMSSDDQRTSIRISHETALIIEDCDSATYTYGRMYNYSAGGLYFESDVAFQPGTRVRIDIEKSDKGLSADGLIAKVKWCQEISAAVVLYDYGIGVAFAHRMNLSERNGKFKVIQGGAGSKSPFD